MKKYLLLFCLLGMVQLAYGRVNDDLLVQNDTIIVEFGKSGKIVVIVDNKEDFERLKGMNINQIIRELDLAVDEKSGELVVVEVQGKKGTKEVVRVREEGLETEVNVGGIRVTVDETSGDTKVRVQTGTV